MRYETVFLFDVDNTLLDNDRVQADLDAHIHLGTARPHVTDTGISSKSFATSWLRGLRRCTRALSAGRNAQPTSVALR